MSLFVFAGTHEGRALAVFLSENQIEATVLVATEYGELLLPSLPCITVQQGRLGAAQMVELFAAGDCIIDATHPYATEVTENIKLAACCTGATYWRLVRNATPRDASVIVVASAQEAADYLSAKTGAILLTTGSKDLQTFSKVYRFAERIWVRMLPAAEAISDCLTFGYQNAKIIAIQGPFSVEMNIAMLKMTHAKFLVTKDGGKAGGMEEKLYAAKACGAQVILIDRPTVEQGYSLAQIKTMLMPQGEAQKYLEKPFPLFLRLDKCRVVIAGGGGVAKRRVEKLKAFGVTPIIIAPEKQAGLTLTSTRELALSDLIGADFVIAATDNRKVNHAIAEYCKTNHIFCSVADCAEESTAIFPAICEGDGLVCGMISQNGEHSRLAHHAQIIRNLLQKGEGEA